MDKHELIQALKSLALELGRTPTRAEFIHQTKGGYYKLTKLFGTFTVLLQAAGLDTYDVRRGGGVKQEKPPRIDNSIFERDLEQHLEQHTEAEVGGNVEPWPTVAVISDIHWPFASSRVVKRFTEWVKSTQPEYVFLNGDAWDFYSHSKYPRSHNIFTPREEERLAREMNGEFWEKIKAVSPESKLHQMLGNHDVRPMKRVLEAYPEAEDWITDRLTKLFTFDGVATEMDARQEILLPGNIAVFHGYRSQAGAHRDYTLMNCVTGHTHSGGAAYRRIRGVTLWELNSGVAGDPTAKGLTYTPQKITHWTPGFGAIDASGPRFIPA